MTFNFLKPDRQEINKIPKMPLVFRKFRRSAREPSTDHGLQAYLMVIFVTLVMVSDLISWAFYVAHTGRILYQYLNNFFLGSSGPLQILFSKWDLILSVLVSFILFLAILVVSFPAS
ncbi:hypothetical protein BDW66DRAFT_31604 [Aspergillus desertorum]